MQAVLPSRLPLISAPMAGCAGGQLSSEVVLAGGFAFIGAGHKDVQYLEEELKIARELLKQPTGRLCSIGVGFLTWRLEQLMSKEDAERMVEKACKETSAIWLAFGNDLQRWVELAQRCSNEVKVVILVTSVEQALEAAALGADVLVIQGSEAGGHGSAVGQPLFSLFPQVATAIEAAATSSMSPCGPGNAAAPILLAAGGLVHPSQCAAALTLPSCSGIVLGTALVATSASQYSPSQKRAIVAAKATGPRTLHFDRMRNTVGWPTWVNGRALENRSSQDELSGVDEEELRKRYAEALKTGDADRVVTWAGTSVASVTEEPSIAVIMCDIERGIKASLEDALKRWSKL